MACPGQAHEGNIVELRHPDDGTGQSNVSRRHPVHRTMRLDLFVGDMNTSLRYLRPEGRAKLTYVVERHTMELEKPGEGADLVDEARSQFVLQTSVNVAPRRV